MKKKEKESEPEEEAQEEAKEELPVDDKPRGAGTGPGGSAP